MVIVTGSVRGRPETIDRLIEVSLEHVHRSRTEPGCLLHSVHRDVEDALRLVFVEHWADLDALRTHFAVPEANAFVREAATLGDPEAPRTRIEIYEATPVRP